MQPQQPYETYRTLPAQYSYGPPADSYGNHPSYAPGQQQHPPQPQTLAMGYGPPPPSVSYKSTYTPHLHQHLQQLEQSPISYMTVDEPTSAGGSGGGQHSPTRPMVTAAAASDTRQSSSSTNRTSFSNDPGSAGGSHRASTTRISGRKGSLPAASKAEPLVIDEDEGDGKKKRKRVERACCMFLAVPQTPINRRLILPPVSPSHLPAEAVQVRRPAAVRSLRSQQARLRLPATNPQGHDQVRLIAIISRLCCAH